MDVPTNQNIGGDTSPASPAGSTPMTGVDLGLGLPTLSNSDNSILVLRVHVQGTFYWCSIYWQLTVVDVNKIQQIATRSKHPVLSLSLSLSVS